MERSRVSEIHSNTKAYYADPIHLRPIRIHKASDYPPVIALHGERFDESPVLSVLW